MGWFDWVPDALLLAFVIGFAAKIMMLAIPVYDTNHFGDVLSSQGAQIGGVINGNDYLSMMDNYTVGNIAIPGGPASSQSGFTGFLYRITDLITLNWVWNLAGSVYNLIYVFPDMLNSAVGSQLDATMRDYLFNKAYGMFYMIFHFGYLFWFFSMITGKKLGSAS